VKALITNDVGAVWQDLPADLDVRLCPGTVTRLNAALDARINTLATDALPSAVERATGLRWVQLLSSGADQLVGHPLLAHGVLVSSAAGIAVHIAKFAVARLQRDQAWPDRGAQAWSSLRGMYAVLIGYGGVGRATARWSYHGYLPYPGASDPEAAISERIVATGELHAVLPDADVVLLAVPLTLATRHLLDAAALVRLRPSAIVVNTARAAHRHRGAAPGPRPGPPGARIPRCLR
jgi:phosphoglycerate dehydrogenase-like enzyme